MRECRPIILDKTLVSDLGDQHGVGPEKDLFGVEVELEGKKIKTQRDSITKYWKPHEDGSLRVFKPGAEACEYVFRHPLNMADTRTAITNLFNYLNKNADEGVEVFDSYRTSIHVHVNCLNDSIRTIVNFITLSIIFDELFVSQNGETRVGNNFCLRSRDAEGQIADLCQSVSKFGSLYNLSMNDRYSAINFTSLCKFGTVEFRSLECTTDIERVMHWIGTIQALKEAARHYESPREIIAKYSQRGPTFFMISNLGQFYGKYCGVEGAQRMLQNGMRLAQDFAYCSDWQPPGEGYKEKPQKAGLKKKMIHLDIEAQNVWGAPPAPPPGMIQAPQWFFQNHVELVDPGAIPVAQLAEEVVDEDDDEDFDLMEPEEDDDDFQP